jgi:hypothetical protein
LMAVAMVHGQQPVNPEYVSKPFQIGASDGAQGLFSGTVDDVRVYNRALSAAEVQNVYNAEK